MPRVVFVLLMTFLLTARVAGSQTAPAKPPAPPARDARAPKTETAAIKGRVLSVEGRPLRRAQIRATAAELREARTVSTDTEGYYELTELPGGRYTIRVTRSGYVPLSYGQRYPGELSVPVRLGSGERLDNINFVLPRAGVIAGRILDEVGDPIAAVSVYAMQLRYFSGRRRLVPIETLNRTDDTGQFRLGGLMPGEYYVMASTRETWVVVDKDKQRTVMSFAPTYYPGSPNVATAQRVKVGVGQEVTGTDFAMAIGRVARIRGTVLDANGGPLAGARISLNQEMRGPGGMSMSSAGGATAAADGTFTIDNVSPGEYKITTRGVEAASPEGATQVIVVDGGDIEGLVLAVSAGGSVSGQVMVEGDGAFPVPLSRLRVVARSVDNVVTINTLQGSPNGAVSEDGKFEFSGLLGTQRLSVTGVPEGWMVKAIDRDGVDLADLDLTLRSGERWDGARIVLSDRLTTVNGTVSVDRDQQTGTGTVVLFREEPSLWGEASRHVRAARPSQTGEFEVKGLLPGRYLGIAVEFLQDGNWFDPEVLHGLIDRATRFTLAEGETRTLKLELKK